LARAKKDQEMEVEKLKLLGSLYERSCEHESAMNHLEKALVIRKESEYSKQEVIGIYIQIGYELLKEGAGNEQIALNLYYKALTLYQKALAEECCYSKGQLDSICSGIGIAYHCLGEWDSAIILLKKSVECVEHAEHKAYAYLYLGSTYLEVYRITDDPEEQIRILNQALEHVMKCDSKLIELETDKQFSSVKILYLLGLREHAFRILDFFFDLEGVGSRRTHVYCECCGQHDEKSVKLWMCSGCKVQCNCNKSHQRKRWRGKFADHRTLCPLLNRWRKVMKKMKIGKHSKDSFEAIMNNYLDTIEKDYSKDHIGTEDRRRGSALRSLVFLQVCINSASSYYITYAPADTTYLNCLKESNLLSKQDIEMNDLYFWSCHNASQLRFEYIASLDPEGSKRYRYEGRPLIHAMIHHYHDSNEFSMFLATALKHHPGDIGLLFQKDNECKTAFECALNKYGNEAVFGVIEERIPVNGAKLPILHHVGQHARQHFKEFGKWNPSAVFLRENKGREIWQALLASGSRTFNKDSKFFETMTDDQVNEVDPASGLYPFMMSASGQMTSDLSAVYYLLRRNPSLLSAS
jgi:tetratricopeptide (TPR) repeat protein